MELEVWDPRVDREFVATVVKTVAPHADAIDRDDIYPKDVGRALARAGFASAKFPRALGGDGRPFADLVTIFEEVVAASATSLIASGSSEILENTLGELLVAVAQDA